MHHRLIMVTGSGPGAGKSTLSAFLYRQLLLRGIPAEWLYEEDLLRSQQLAPYRSAWRHGDPAAMPALLDAARTLFLDHPQHGSVRVTDGLFPCFYWLLVKYRRAEVEAYGRELAGMLQPLRPLVVHLDADIRAAFARAVASRGEAFGRDFTRVAAGWTLPYYPGPSVQTPEDYLALTEWLGAHTRELLRGWPSETLILNTTELSLVATRRRLLDALGLTEVAEAPPSPAALGAYGGVYTAADDARPGRCLSVTLRDGRLHIDTYWPAGCPLLSEAPDRFRLANTSHVVHFRRLDGAVAGLIYTYPGTERWYEKVE